MDNRIFSLTGEPVSAELETIIACLGKGENLKLDDFARVPEIVLGRNCAAKGIPTIDIKGREALQRRIKFEMSRMGAYTTTKDGTPLFEGTVYQDRQLHIVMGLPASGKSSTLCNDLSQRTGSYIVDCDEVKKKFPEYNNGWGADLVHEESKMIADEIFMEKLEMGENLILQKVGSSIDSIMKYIELAKMKEYRTYIHYVELPRNIAFARLLNRFIEEGRFYEPGIVLNQSDNLKENYDILKTYCDGYSMWDNNVKRGERSILVETNLDYIMRIDEVRQKNELSRTGAAEFLREKETFVDKGNSPPANDWVSRE